MEMYFSFLLFIIASTSICKVHSSDFTTEYVGCYEDRGTWRTSSSRAMTFAEDMSSSATIERCTSICYHAGKRYAGLQYSYECFCADLHYDRYGEDPGGCNDRCGGNSGQICGDSYRNSVYRITQIMSTSTTGTSPATTTATTTTTTTTTTPTHITSRTTKNRVTATTTTDATIRSNKKPVTTQSTTKTTTRPLTEPDSMANNLGTDIGAGVGVVAGCVAVMIVILVLIKQRAQLKDCRAADIPQHNEAYSLDGPSTENNNNMEAASTHVVNGEVYAVINKTSPTSHSIVISPAYGGSEPAQGAEEAYQNVQIQGGGTAAAYHNTAHEPGNESYVTVPSCIAATGYKAPDDTEVVENDLYGT